MRKLFFIFLIGFNLYGQHLSSRKISRIVKKNPVFSKSHVGVAVQRLGSNKKIKGVQSSKYMTPASNLKILTFLGAIQTFDSLPIINYALINKELHIKSTGYPLLFHPRYPDIELEFFLNSYKNIVYHRSLNNLPRYGPGWAWDDYSYYFSAQTSALPLFGNVVRFTNFNKNQVSSTPSLFKIIEDNSIKTSVVRNETSNIFKVNSSIPLPKDTIYVPFKTSEKLVTDLLNFRLESQVTYDQKDLETYKVLYTKDLKKIYKAVLHDSDNLIAESLLMMISKELNDDFLISKTIRKLKRKWNLWVPDEILWYDGSGLSRYSMITPRTLIAVLQKINEKIGLNGIQNYFAAGGLHGNIKNFYEKAGGPFVYAKTGTLKNNHNLSGYIISEKGNWYTFSIMVNHFESSTNEIRIAIGELLDYIYKKG